LSADALLFAGGHITVTHFATIVVAPSAGNDDAYLIGRDAPYGFPPAGHNFTATPTWARLFGGGHTVTVIGFKLVRAEARGAFDTAHLYDGAGDDVFIGTRDSSSLSAANNTYTIVASGFSQVVATSSTGNDVAYLYDGRGDDTFVGTRTYSSLGGAGYDNQVNGFFQVTASSSGGHDTAALNDSSQDDVFSGLGANALLFGADYVVSASAFGQVQATSSLGGNDNLFLQSVNYQFQQFGNWVVPPPNTPVPPPPTYRTVIG
jgi:hypothetical protein